MSLYKRKERGRRFVVLPALAPFTAPRAKLQVMATMELIDSGMVAQTVGSWNQIVCTLHELEVLRREGLFRAA